MTVLLTLLDVGLTSVAGAMLASVVRTPLRFIERILVAIVAGVIAGSAVTYVLALLAGLNKGTVLAGPAVLLIAALAIARWTGDPRAPWIESWNQDRLRWKTQPPWLALGLGAFAAVAFALIFAHTLYQAGGAVAAGYPTVWADWSQHLTTEASFAVAGNLPPQNPLLSGTPLLYPFLPDFHSASLMTLGLSRGAALAAPGAALALVCALLIVAFARRLGASAGAGVIAALICFVGGGIGFEAAFSDACIGHGYSSTQCTLPYVVTHPGEAGGVIAGTLHDIPGIVLAQPRAYDGLPSDSGPAGLPAPLLSEQQWYTPLMAWWLPQRTILYGFAAALCALILVFAGMRDEHKSWGAYGLAGLLLGLLPLVHVQTLIAVGLVLLILAARHRRVEWLALFGVAFVLAASRLVQLLTGPHGSAAFCNQYPWLKPGWLANTDKISEPCGRIAMSIPGFFIALWSAVVRFFSADWWLFWLVNLGVAVPLCAVLVILAGLRYVPRAAGPFAKRAVGIFPGPLLEFSLAAMAIFAVCNVVVFQSWDWDNTKLFVYWYLAVALLVGALSAFLWRGLWRRTVAIAMVGTMVLTGLLVVVRLGPWTPAMDSVNGPYTIADAQERSLAATIAAGTPKTAVFLTFGRPNDPILTLAGRTGVMGYYGWLWSYGVDFGSRYTDVTTMYRGCAVTQQSVCPIPGLLRAYRISFVEIDDRLRDAGAIEPATDLTWWAAQNFPVVGRTDHITVYDVRSAG